MSESIDPTKQTDLTDEQAKQLLDLLSLYWFLYGTSSGQMSVEEVIDDLKESLP